MLKEQKIYGSQYLIDSSEESLDKVLNEFSLFLNNLNLNPKDLLKWEKNFKEATNNPISDPIIIAWTLRGNEIYLEIFDPRNLNVLKIISKTHPRLNNINPQSAIYDLEIASKFQEKLLPLPHFPENDRWTLFSRRKSSLNVAGDYADAYQNKDGDLFLIAADVMGKGITAAFLAAMIHIAFDIHLESNLNLTELIHALNHIIIQETKNLTIFATCSIAFIPKSCSHIEVINAAHCPPLLFSGTHLIHQFLPSGPPLGLFENSRYTPEILPLTKDEQLIMLTDGLYEWKRKDNAWGWKNLLKFIPNHLNSPEELWNALQSKINQCASPNTPNDDQTLLFWTQKS